MRRDENDAAELFAVWYPPLAGWCRGLVGDDSTAHEIASEAFTRLWSRWRTVEEPRPYLYAVSANLVKNHWRSLERERGAVRRLTAVPGQHAPAADRGTVLRQLVEDLPERLRVPVLLHYYADLTVAEIARAVRRRPGTVKSDLYQARQRLRAALREEDNDDVAA